ncbi:MAG: KH domain-containing protein, partial [Spirochaetia bacterium]|nr:KH domain-containing protein [Spirochaetia bacterium]
MVVVEKSGKTAEEAILAALAELKIKREDVEIEILEASKSSLFGLFGGKDAKVKVTVKDESKLGNAQVKEEPVKVVEEAVEKAPEPVHQPIADAEEEVALDQIQTAADKDEAIAMAREFLQKIFQSMKMEVLIEKFYNKAEEATYLKLHGPDMGVLIGKHGQTLDSLQYLTNLVANKNSAERIRIIIDIEDYRVRRQKTLERLAKNLA